jgi:hypothetical protein
VAEEPSGKYNRVLSRTKKISYMLYEKIIVKLKRMGRIAAG